MKQFFQILLLFGCIIFIFGVAFCFNTKQIVAAPGDSCFSSTDCYEDAGERCEGGNEEEDIEGHCVAEEDEEGERIGGPCINDSDCRSGLVCRGSTCDRETDVDSDRCTSDSDCLSGDECVDGVCTSPGQPPPSSSDYGLGSVPPELPREDIAEIIVRIVRYVVGLVGVILLVMLIYGGVMYMTSAGNEEQIGKAKKVLTYAIIGIVVVALSFLISEFVINALTGSNGGRR